MRPVLRASTGSSSVKRACAGKASWWKNVLLTTTSDGPATAHSRAAMLMQSPIAPMCARPYGRSSKIERYVADLRAGRKGKLR